ncbi:methyltransferase domain-containing protein [Streptomyces sp. HC44]|uniref:Methyltransferase domain-containing protein n=1 Tax=Streptomyces scabichelini TaxID=2711217 RepID=A0A6G4V2P6_9ACTN|nr:methyltransferase domain-containing protein [Streptomyces scabichelini]NGO08276.1 methyltransferase domain-containing protein [Streptomyces scabichelini]
MTHASAVANPVVDAVLDAIEIPENAAVVDLACGLGRPSLTLAARRSDVTVLGVDLDPAAIGHARAEARALGATNAEFAVMPLEQLTIPAASTDVIVSTFGLLQVGDPRQSLREAVRIMRLGSRFSLATYGDMRSNTLWSLAAPILAWYAPPGTAPGSRVQSFPDSTARKELLREAGFGEVEESTVDFFIRLPDFAAIWRMLSQPGMFGGIIDAFCGGTAVSVQRDLRSATEVYADAPGGEYVFPASCLILRGTLHLRDPLSPAFWNR